MKKIKKFKMLFIIIMVLALGTSCKKEPLVSTENQITTDHQKLHPLGAKLEDPSLINKVGYYNPENTILQRGLPSSVDFSDKMPDVGDQGSQPSCAGWAFGYYYKTYQEVVEKGWNKNNNAYSPSWIYNQINGGVCGNAYGSAACDLLVNSGCDFIDNFSYNESNCTKQPDNASKINAHHYKAQTWKYLVKTKEAFKTVLASSQAFVILIPVYPDFDYLNNSSNLIYDDFSGTSRGDHFVCIVGYDDNKQAFKFINSWGTDFGQNGYGWMAYSKIPDIHNAYLLTDKTNVYNTGYLTGDFNGDGAYDILTANNYGFYGSWKGISGLKRFNASTYTDFSVTAYATGDFNGDGKTDIFCPVLDKWYVSYSGTGNMTLINSFTLSTYALSSLSFGDFNGDGKTDVFRVNGSDWYVSYSGTGSWTLINSISTSTFMSTSFGFGDFNGDGKTDVFKAYGSNWYVSYSGTGSWTNINTSPITLSQIGFGDFNGDGKTDVFYATGSSWYRSYSGTGSITKINTSSVTIDKLGLCDLNGDRKCDVFYPTSSSWRVSWGGTASWNNL